MIKFALNHPSRLVTARDVERANEKFSLTRSALAGRVTSSTGTFVESTSRRFTLSTERVERAALAALIKTVGK